jgi:hypothetical protein
MPRLLTIICFSFLFTCSFAQSKKIEKSIPAVRSTGKIVIDGDISEDAWKKAPLATKFIEWRPTFGKVEDDGNKTEVFIVYDDEAIYIGGFCHEVSNDSISKELVGRDVVGVNDFIGVLFDTYHDKINGFGYYVTPLGEQYDAKYSNTGEDGTWNSVYESNSKIVPGGWTFEMKIPYSAIRFSSNKKQTWGINITRRRSKSGKQYMWYPTDPTVGGTLFAQAGTWANIEDIKAPLRLSLSPYVSAYTNHYPYNDPTQKNWTSSVSGGMDVKYGINQAFTLDMTLIPDFGQVQSDNQVLNLTPFEVKYNEYRTFFTEGTELFNKGGLFYSRRIGGTPLHYYDVYNELNANETVVQNPTTSKLINAAKISGRTASGLGVGFFNAITAAQYATVEDDLGNTRKIQTSPLTNYNIIVLDQSLKNNSSISFINTSTLRSGNDYDANVTAGLWDFYDKKNKYNFFGQVALSQLYGYTPGKTLLGYNHSIGFAKPSGNFNFNIYQNLSDANYQQNDMGYATNNNFMNSGLWMGYKILKPNSWRNNMYFNFNFTHSMHYLPFGFQSVDINANVNSQLKNLWSAAIYVDYAPAGIDYYEPRVQGRTFKNPCSGVIDVSTSTNTSKKYSASLEFTYSTKPAFHSKGYDVSIGNQYRFNKKLTIGLNDNLSWRFNNVGFATTSADSIIFGNRSRYTVENILNIKYNFTNKMGITFRARHYWSRVSYHNFFNLNTSGNLDAISSTYTTVNDNVNFFNIDMVYTWQFALGSFLNVGWKNAIVTDDANIITPYFKNASNTFGAPQNNNFSVKVIYFLDSQKLKAKKAT